jgi:hypothetical protein
MLAQNLARYQQATADEIGCDPPDFHSNTLTVVERPAQARDPWALLIVTFGTGTVISADRDYLPFIAGRTIEPHYRAFYPPVLLEPLARHAAAIGREIAWRGANLGFVPASQPRSIPAAAGLELVRVDAAWRERHIASGVFSNALGDSGDSIAAASWRFALVLVDADGTPAAVAGAYDDGPGRLEIGVDVARPFRGTGLAPGMVTAMAREAIGQGLLPTYYCAPTNIRSQRTALSCGFMPVVSIAQARTPRPA